MCLIIPLGFSNWLIAIGNLTLVTVGRQMSLMIWDWKTDLSPNKVPW